VKWPLLDQGLRRLSGAMLALGGWDVTHASQIAMSRADDIDVLERAKMERVSAARSPRCCKPCGRISEAHLRMAQWLP
jgi:predicted NAD-dependent protein-ADP-ribosyltransferase YbiA (DUF1768 family)